jgi:predicted nucleotidyltransferase
MQIRIEVIERNCSKRIGISKTFGTMDEACVWINSIKQANSTVGIETNLRDKFITSFIKGWEMIADELKQEKIEWFLTGSRAFGLENNVSDYDVVVKLEDMTKILEIIHKMGLKVDVKNSYSPMHEDEVQSEAVIKIVYNDRKIDFIVHAEKSYKIMEEATLIMKEIAGSRKSRTFLMDKSIRYEMFIKIKQLLAGKHDINQ